jgi:hypothetical protein
MHLTNYGIVSTMEMRNNWMQFWLTRHIVTRRMIHGSDNSVLYYVTLARRLVWMDDLINHRLFD